MNKLTRREALAAMALGPLLGGVPVYAREPRRIIISGASGQLGGLTIRALLKRGVPARNLILVSRTPQSLAEYVRLGAVARFGDFTEPQSLPGAYAGGERMLLISISGGAGPRPVAHGHAIDAARKAGVKQIAYTSWVAISKGATTGLAADHLATEDLLRKSGLSWTFLRNSIYMEVVLPQAVKMVADGKAVLPAEEHPIGYVTRENCAEAAAAVLSTPGHDNKAYDITGAELIGVREIAAAVTAVSGKRIELVSADPGAPPPRSFGSPEAAVTSTAVADLTGQPPTSLKDFLMANKSQLLAS
jgi:NAD(P)H dehydrogenase (quinone)